MQSNPSNNLPIYLDFNASAPVLPEVAQTMAPWLNGGVGNSSSKHVYGQRARETVEGARRNLAGLIHCKPSEIIFTGGGTEASTLALKGLAPPARGLWGKMLPGFRLYLSPADHPASIETGFEMAKIGQARLKWMELDKAGRVDLEKAARLIRPGRGLVTTLVAHNESGTLQPVRELADLCNKKGVPLHADGAQVVGKIPCDVRELGCDLLTIAGHKMGAPQGIGALFVREGICLKPQVFGGGQEGGLRAGTEPVALIAGLGEAARVAREAMQLVNPKIAELRDELWNLLSHGLGDRILRVTHPTMALPNTLFVAIRNTDTGRLLNELPRLCASTGSACHDGRHQSRLLGAMGIDKHWHTGTLRLSLGRTTSKEEIITAVGWILEKAQSSS